MLNYTRCILFNTFVECNEFFFQSIKEVVVIQESRQESTAYISVSPNNPFQFPEEGEHVQVFKISRNIISLASHLFLLVRLTTPPLKDTLPTYTRHTSTLFCTQCYDCLLFVFLPISTAALNELGCQSFLSFHIFH